MVLPDGTKLNHGKDLIMREPHWVSTLMQTSLEMKVIQCFHIPMMRILCILLGNF